jgi:multidrug transporter EmrE-like cation transporter
MVKHTRGGDVVDKFLNGTNWKVGNFNMRPIFFGVVMASIDVLMMGAVKMVHQGTLSQGFGIPFALFFYALQPLLFLKAMNYEGMAVTNLIWNLTSDVVVTLQGIFVFGESIAGMRWVAVGMALVSLTIFAYTGGD